MGKKRTVQIPDDIFTKLATQAPLGTLDYESTDNYEFTKAYADKLYNSKEGYYATDDVKATGTFYDKQDRPKSTEELDDATWYSNLFGEDTKGKLLRMSKDVLYMDGTTALERETKKALEAGLSPETANTLATEKAAEKARQANMVFGSVFDVLDLVGVGRSVTNAIVEEQKLIPYFHPKLKKWVLKEATKADFDAGASAVSAYGPRSQQDNWIASFSKSFKNGMASLPSTVAGFNEWVGDLGEASINYLSGDGFKSDESYADRLSDRLNKAYERAEDKVAPNADNLSSLEGLSGGIGAGIASLIQYSLTGGAATGFGTLTGAGAAKLIGQGGIQALSKTGMLTGGFVLNGGEAYKSAKQAGLSEEDAALMALAVGGINTGIEMKFGSNLLQNYLVGARGAKEIPKIILQETGGDMSKLNQASGSIISRITKAFNDATKVPVIGTALEEGSEEFMQSLVSSTSQFLYNSFVANNEADYGKGLYEHKNLGEVFTQAFEEAAVGAIVGGLAGFTVKNDIAEKESVMPFITSGQTDLIMSSLQGLADKGQITPETFESYKSRVEQLDQMWNTNKRVFEAVAANSNVDAEVVKATALSLIDKEFELKQKVTSFQEKIAEIKADPELADAVKDEKIKEVNVLLDSTKQQLNKTTKDISDLIPDENGDLGVDKRNNAVNELKSYVVNTAKTILDVNEEEATELLDYGNNKEVVDALIDRIIAEGTISSEVKEEIKKITSLDNKDEFIDKVVSSRDKITAGKKAEKAFKAKVKELIKEEEENERKANIEATKEKAELLADEEIDEINLDEAEFEEDEIVLEEATVEEEIVAPEVEIPLPTIEDEPEIGKLEEATYEPQEEPVSKLEKPFKKKNDGSGLVEVKATTTEKDGLIITTFETITANKKGEKKTQPYKSYNTIDELFEDLGYVENYEGEEQDLRELSQTGTIAVKEVRETEGMKAATIIIGGGTAEISLKAKPVLETEETAVLAIEKSKEVKAKREVAILDDGLTKNATNQERIAIGNLAIENTDLKRTVGNTITYLGVDKVVLGRVVDGVVESRTFDIFDELGNIKINKSVDVRLFSQNLFNTGETVNLIVPTFFQMEERGLQDYSQADYANTKEDVNEFVIAVTDFNNNIIGYIPTQSGVERLVAEEFKEVALRENLALRSIIFENKDKTFTTTITGKSPGFLILDKIENQKPLYEALGDGTKLADKVILAIGKLDQLYVNNSKKGTYKEEVINADKITNGVVYSIVPSSKKGKYLMYPMQTNTIGKANAETMVEAIRLFIKVSSGQKLNENETKSMNAISENFNFKNFNDLLAFINRIAYGTTSDTARDEYTFKLFRDRLYLSKSDNSKVFEIGDILSSSEIRSKVAEVLSTRFHSVKLQGLNSVEEYTQFKLVDRVITSVEHKSYQDYLNDNKILTSNVRGINIQNNEFAFTAQTVIALSDTVIQNEDDTRIEPEANVVEEVSTSKLQILKDLENNLPSNQDNTRSQATKDIIKWTEIVFGKKFEGNFEKGEYIGFLSSLGDEGYEATSLLNAPKQALTKLKESAYYKAFLKEQENTVEKNEADVVEEVKEEDYENLKDKIIVFTLSGTRSIKQLESELDKKYELINLGNNLLAFTTDPVGTVTTYYIADLNNKFSNSSFGAFSIYKNYKGEFTSVNKPNVEMITKANNMNLEEVYNRLELAKSILEKQIKKTKKTLGVNTSKLKGRTPGAAKSEAEVLLETKITETVTKEELEIVKEDLELSKDSEAKQAIKEEIKNVIDGTKSKRTLTDRVKKIIARIIKAFTVTAVLISLNMPLTSYVNYNQNNASLNKAFVTSGALSKLTDIGKEVYLNEIKNNKAFILVDKPTATTYIIGSNGELIKDFPAILGAATGETKNMSKANPTTPAGRYELMNPVKEWQAKPYHSRVLLLKGQGGVAIHETFYGELAQRTASLNTTTVDDNRMSRGCVNISPSNYDKYLKPHISAESIILITPDVPVVTEVIPEFAQRGSIETAEDLMKKCL